MRSRACHFAVGGLVICASSGCASPQGEASTRDAAPPAVVSVSLHSPERATDANRRLRLVFGVEPHDAAALEQAMQRARQRIDALQLRVPIKLQTKGQTLVLELGAATSEQVKRIVHAALGQSRLSVAVCRDAGDPLGALASLPRPDDIAIDSEWVDIADGRGARSTFFWTPDKPSRALATERLVLWLSRVATSIDGVRVGPATRDAETGVRSYVIELPPSGLRVAAASVEETSSPESSVRVSLDPASRRVFADLTEGHMFQRLALMIDDEVLMAPSVRSPIPGGVLMVTLGSGAGPSVAQELATSLTDSSDGPKLVLLREEQLEAATGH